MTKAILFTLIACFTVASPLLGQQGTVAAGGDASGTGGSVSYSIGQVDYLTKSGENGFISEGLQQPYKVEGVGVNHPEVDVSVSAFPNPAREQVTLLLSGGTARQAHYRLTDAAGRMIREESVTSSRTILEVDHLAAGTYFLSVFRDQQLLETFKLVKPN